MVKKGHYEEKFKVAVEKVKIAGKKKKKLLSKSPEKVKGVVGKFL